jgi:thioredoxin 1
MVLQVATKREFDDIVNSDKRVAVHFTATWNGPCRFIGPKFEAFADSFETIKFIKVDVDENSETSEVYQISAMPTFKFFVDGKPFGEDMVEANEKELHHKLEQLAAC